MAKTYTGHVRDINYSTSSLTAAINLFNWVIVGLFVYRKHNWNKVEKKVDFAVCWRWLDPL